jgi:hypothetical protein
MEATATVLETIPNTSRQNPNGPSGEPLSVQARIEAIRGKDRVRGPEERKQSSQKSNADSEKDHLAQPNLLKAESTFNTIKTIEVDDNLLRCQICMNRFDLQKRPPLSLKCGHTLCEACAKELCKDRPVRCPFDKKSADCSSTDQMGKNYVILDLIEAEKAKASCSFGDRTCPIHQS